MDLGKLITGYQLIRRTSTNFITSGLFSLENPVALQRKVFFEVMLFLCRRGRENLRNLKKDSFAIKSDGEGREYILLVVDEMTKNHRENDVHQDGGVIYATMEAICPVESFKLYMQKLNPKLNVFFQRPKPSFKSDDSWYDAQVLGVKTLEQMMKKISVDAELSMVYTNHCIRATSITLLDTRGFEARHIMSVSGHRSESSLRSYSKTDLCVKRKMSSDLADFIYSKKRNFSFQLNLDSDDEDSSTAK